jgi:hypothetical protein
MGACFRRALALFRRRRLERDLEDELAFHPCITATRYTLGLGQAAVSAWVAISRANASIASP